MVSTYSLGQNKMADIEKEEVLVRLRKISLVQLEEICGTLQLTVGDQKKCKQKAMLNAVFQEVQECQELKRKSHDQCL